MSYELTASLNSSSVMVASSNHYILFILKKHLVELGVNDVQITERVGKNSNQTTERVHYYHRR